MDRKVYIYGLYDPITKELRYVGKTNDIKQRLWGHIRDAKGGQRTYKATWIRKLLVEGHEPVISEIQETTQDGWQKDEKKCIAQAIAEGASLTNLTKGGDGIVGYNHSDETKRKISEYNKSIGRVPPKWKGKKQSPEHIRKRVEARKKNNSYKHTEQAKENISKGRKGKNMGNTHTLGMKQSEESNRKRGESIKKFYENNPEAREEARQRMMGNKYNTKKPRSDKGKTCASCGKKLSNTNDCIVSKSNGKVEYICLMCDEMMSVSECLCSVVDVSHHELWCPADDL